MAGSFFGLPLWQLTIVVLGVALLIGLGFSIGIRKLLRLNPTTEQADLAIDLMQVASTYIGILLAFAGVLAWQDFKLAQTAIEEEAAAGCQLYRDFTIYGSQMDQPRHDLRVYVSSIVDDEWPLMSGGARSERTEAILIRLFDEVGSANPVTQRQIAIYQQALAQLNQLVKLRRDRLASSQAQIPPVLWVVAIVGSILTIAYASAFVSSRYSSLMISGVSLTIGLMFLFLLSVDNPFRGREGIDPAPLVQLSGIFDRIDYYHRAVSRGEHP